MPFVRNRPMRTAAREPLSRRDLAEYGLSRDVHPGPDTNPGLAEMIDRQAEDAKPRACPLCEGPGAYDPHDPACPLAHPRRVHHAR